MADKNKLESPALPNNFSAKAPLQDLSPKVGEGNFTPSTSQSHNRGKDGTKG